MAIKGIIGHIDAATLNDRMNKTAQQKQIAKKNAQRRRQQRERQEQKAATPGCDAWRENLQRQLATQRARQTKQALTRRENNGRFISREAQLAAIQAVDGTSMVVFVKD